MATNLGQIHEYDQRDQPGGIGLPGSSVPHPGGVGHPRPSSDGGWMFWVLVGMAVAVFAPCVVLPVWREYQALKYAEQVEQAAVDQARDDLFMEQRRLAALQNDPAVIGRLARRDLHYNEQGERVIAVHVANEVPAEEATTPITPVEPPAVVAGLIDKLPEADYDSLFCRPQNRLILMALSGALVLAALALFPARRPL